MHNNGNKKALKISASDRRLVLILGDLIFGYTALVIALFVWTSRAEWLGFSFEFFQTRVPLWFYFLPFLWVILLTDLYDPHQSLRIKDTFRRIIFSGTIGVIFYALLYLVSEPESLPRIGVAVFIVTAIILTYMWRILYIRLFTASRFIRRMILLGAGRSGKVILDVINKINPLPFQVIGILDDNPDLHGKSIDGIPILGGSEKLLGLIEEENVTDILVAISGEMHGHTFQALLDAQEHGIEITRMPVLYEELSGRVPIQLLEADWILRSFVDQTSYAGFYELGKRLVDILGGLLGMSLLLVILPFVAFFTIIDSGLPIFYTQTRLGKGGKPYEILKFRTMRQDAEADGRPRWAKKNDERATRFGLFLRKSHLDEVPQFLNVLRGDMSLIGPRSERPELVEHFQQYVPFYRSRLLVKPGITGWAQVNYPYASTVEETINKLEYDLYYIKHKRLYLDLVVLLRTPATIFGMRGQ